MLRQFFWRMRCLLLTKEGQKHLKKKPLTNHVSLSRRRWALKSVSFSDWSPVLAISEAEIGFPEFSQ
jgi:hypothetical protein